MKYRLKSLKKLRRWEELVAINNLYYLLNGAGISVCDFNLDLKEKIKIKNPVQLRSIGNELYIETVSGQVFIYEVVLKKLKKFEKVQGEGYSSYIDNGKLIRLDWGQSIVSYNFEDMSAFKEFIIDKSFLMNEIFKDKHQFIWLFGINCIIKLSIDYQIVTKEVLNYNIVSTVYDTNNDNFISIIKQKYIGYSLVKFDKTEKISVLNLSEFGMPRKLCLLNKNKWLALMFDNKLEVYSIDNWELLMEHEFEHIASPIRVEMDGNLLLLSLCYYCEILEIEELDN